MLGTEKPRTKGDKMKRITIPMENLKVIAWEHVYNNFGPFEMLFGDTVIDGRVYIDEDGAHIMMPNVKGELDE